MVTAVKETPKKVTPSREGDNTRASWNFSLQHIRANTSHCSPEGKEALVSAFRWCIDEKHPISRDEFSRRVGYSPNTIYKIFTGKYRDPEGKQLDVPDKLVTAIKHFLAIERDRFLGGKNEFVMTPSAKRVYNACDLARESRTPVFLFGPSHIGKTWALTQYSQENNHGRTIYCRMKAASGLGGMVRRLGTRVGISDNTNTANLVDYIKNALTPDMLPIIDEVHLLQYTYRKQSFFGCIEVLREIIDEVGCGMVFSGTMLLIDKLKEGEHAEMEQVLRRGVHRIRMPNMPTKADITAIAKHWHLEFPKRGDVVSVAGVQDKPHDIIRQLAKRAGLKAITERLRYGRKLATRREEKLSWAHFVEAHLSISAEAEPIKDWN